MHTHAHIHATHIDTFTHLHIYVVHITHVVTHIHSHVETARYCTEVYEAEQAMSSSMH